MKTMNTFLVAVVVNFLAAGVSLAQNNDAPAPLSSQNGKQYTIDGKPQTIDIDFTDTTLFSNTWRYMALGWQWDYDVPTVINKRLGTNVLPFERYKSSIASSSPNRTTYWNYRTRTIYHVFQAQALEWHPAIAAQNIYDFTPTPGDTSGAVLGFRNRGYGRAVTTKGSPHFMNLVLEDSTAARPDTILAFSRPYYNARHKVMLVRDSGIVNDPKPENDWRGTDATLDPPNRNGEKWYFTVHMKRSDNTTTTNDPTAPVMGFRIKYFKFPTSSKRVDSAYIRFDSISTTQSGIRRVPGRGYMDGRLQATPATADSTLFIVRRNMLRGYDSNPDSAYVTLSAFFKTFQHLPGVKPTTNPFFPLKVVYNYAETETDIDSIDIECWYYGNCNVAVDWVRLETPYARSLFRGERDSLLAAQLDMDLREFRADRQKDNTKRVRIASFYGIDEIEAMPYYLRFHRYLSSLYDRRLITEAGSSPAYVHMIPQRAYWTAGNFLPNHQHAITNPFKPRGWVDGEQKTNDSTFFMEKTWANRWGGWTDPNGKPEARNFDCVSCGEYGYGFPATVAENPPLQPSHTTQSNNNNIPLCYNEQTYFYVGERSTSMLYGKAPWYDYVNVHTTYEAGLWKNKINAQTDSIAPCVIGYTPGWAEQMRSQLWWNLVLGCKGFLYDGFHTSDIRPFERLRNPKDSIDSVYAPASIAPMTNRGKRQGLLIGSLLTLSPDYTFKINGQPDTVGTQTLLDEAVGPDYYTEKTDSLRALRALPDTAPRTVLSSYLGQPYKRSGNKTTRYIDTLYMTAFMKDTLQPTDKPYLYIGMRSVRHEMLKFHDFVRAHEEELLNLELLAYTGKGFHFTRSARADSAEYYRRFIDMRWGAATTRVMNSPLAEPWDTHNTFVDMSVLRRTDVSMDSIFYVGVVNRRTNPMVPARKTDGTLDTAGKRYADQHRYFPGFEFDSLIANPNAPYKYKPYDQYGARIISVPFTYTRPNGRAALLHVQTLDSTLDTVIASTGALRLPYRPGEGRLFRVTVLPADDTVGKGGHLDFSNQRKIVGFNKYRKDPLTGAVVKTDTMVYYSVYYKMAMPPQVAAPARMAIFMRKSKPSAALRDLDFIAWDDTEEVLSDNIRFTDTAASLRVPCMYPSIVVRYDSLRNEPFAYVVFTCTNAETERKTWNWFSDAVLPVFVCEAKVPLVDYSPFVTSRRVLDTCYSNIEYEGDPVGALTAFGHAMINASATGNYYVWSDSLFGVTAAWKDPSALAFSPGHKTHLSWNRALRPDLSTRPAYGWAMCKHPSLNSYSRMSLGETDCGLVWQERRRIVDRNDVVYYTRLRDDGDSLRIFLADTVRGVLTNPERTMIAVPTNMDNTVYTCADHTMPVLYRGIESDLSGNRSADTARSLVWDRIVWQADGAECFNTSQQWNAPNAPIVLSRAIDIVAPVNTPSRLTGRQRSFVWHKDGGVFQPNVSQGVLRYMNDNDPARQQVVDMVPRPFVRYINASDSAGVVNVVVSTANNPDSIPSNTLYNIPFSRWSSTMNLPNELNFSSRQYAIALSTKGTLPHLSALPYLTQDTKWRRTGRIFEADANTPPTIFRSVEWLFKEGAESEGTPAATQLRGFVTRVASKSISPVRLNEREFRFHLLPSGHEGWDTLTTDWFVVPDSSSLRFTDAGDGGQFDKLSIQRMSTGQEFDLLQTDLYYEYVTHGYAYKVLGGGGDSYRVLAVTPIASVNEEQLLLGGLDEGYLHKAGADASSTESLIDLRAQNGPHIDVALSPNPVSPGGRMLYKVSDSDADDRLRPSYVCTIVNALGGVVATAEVMNGVTHSFDTAGLPCGAYSLIVTAYSSGSPAPPRRCSRKFLLVP